MSTVKQIWSCPVCGFEYRSPIRVSAAYCPKAHITTKGRTRTGQARMTLVDPAPTIKVKAPHDKS